MEPLSERTSRFSLVTMREKEGDWHLRACTDVRFTCFLFVLLWRFMAYGTALWDGYGWMVGWLAVCFSREYYRACMIAELPESFLKLRTRLDASR